MFPFCGVNVTIVVSKFFFIFFTSIFNKFWKILNSWNSEFLNFYKNFNLRQMRPVIFCLKKPLNFNFLFTYQCNFKLRRIGEWKTGNTFLSTFLKKLKFVPTLWHFSGIHKFGTALNFNHNLNNWQEYLI